MLRGHVFGGLVLLGVSACTSSGGAADLAAVPADMVALVDLATPDLRPFACLTPAGADWQVVGDVYCRQRGALCSGIDHFGQSNNCTGQVDTGCWGSGEGACCAATIADHAGTPSPTSARWRCVPQGTPICGNGIKERAEACDDGLRNGQACRPGLGASCTYCSSTCTMVPVTPAVSDCITPDNSDWTVSGDTWCAARGKRCVGTAYTSKNGTCAGTLDTQCWSSDPATCCKYPMSDHAGSSPGSARWQCQ